MLNALNKMPYKIAKEFLNSVVDNTSNLYVFIGRPQNWENESAPPSPVDSVKNDYDVWNDITAMKKVIAADSSLGFKRIDWESGTVYFQYDDSVDLSDKSFYVVTDQNRVYKCIYNNNGAASTSKPIHNNSNVETYLDGYKWKFLFEITDSLIRKFAVDQYLPISYDTSVSSQVKVGEILTYRIIDAGEGYAADSTLPVFVAGDGDAVATATCNIVTTAGEIDSATVTDKGSGYDYDSGNQTPVLIRQITSTGVVESAYGLAIVNAKGEIESTSITIEIAGSGYVDGQAIIVASSCQAYAETNELGEVTNALSRINKGGLNFKKARAKIVAAALTEAIIEPIIPPFNGHGSDPETELFATSVLLNVALAYAEGDADFTIDNEFRRVGLIESPKNYGTDTIATSRTLNAKTTLVLDSMSGVFSPSSAIYGQATGAQGICVDVIESNKLRYIRNGDVINGIDFSLEPIRSSSGGIANVTEVINPEVEPYSGNVLFINNRTAIVRNNDQIETITLVLEY